MTPPDTHEPLYPPDAPMGGVSDFNAPDFTSETHSSPTSPISNALSNTSATSNKFLLPIPTPASNKSQSSFALPEAGDDNGLQELPPDIAVADISISADGSFVETTSGSAARELKRRYDHLLGVNKDVRSPYAITSITNQHGKQVFRVGMRSQTGATITSLEIDTQSSSSNSPAQSKRRSRMSINGFLPPSMFKNGGSSTSTAPSNQAHSHREHEPARSPPSGPRKLRKTRSIPDGSLNNNIDSSPRPSAGLSGRAHSHSVSGADMPKFAPRPISSTARPSGDFFSRAMGWVEASPPSSASTDAGMSTKDMSSPDDPTSVDFHQRTLHSKDVIENPFGYGASFDSPQRNSAVFLPLVIREMQSFESGLTARAEPYLRQSTIDSDKPEPESNEPSSSRPNSSNVVPSPKRDTPSFETSRLSRYSTAVFDVIQTYRGLPMLNTLSAESREPTIKMSLSALDGAAPRDDPRFVIWGDIHVFMDDASVLDSHTDLSSSLSGVSRRKSTKSRNSVALPELRLPQTEASRRVLMAATIERWIAQLTSQFDYDELLIFFLTYRTYIDAVDLCHLLICRFHWALEEPTSTQEVMVRQVVRVRTFVAIRYWLLTFFRVDFLPNRELCLLFANWLNTLRRDPILEKLPDALNIVRKLKKIVKDCKTAHTRHKSAKRSTVAKAKPLQSIDRILGDLSNSVNFAASLRKVTQEEEESDVDLDFNPEESSPFPDTVGIQGFASFANQLGPSNTAAGPEANRNSSGQGGTASVSRPHSSASNIMLQQPLHMTILQHAKAGPPGAELPLVQTPATLPVHHSALSRAVVNTIGRLGRWKRVLSSRSPQAVPLAPCADVSAFDLELNAAGDLLTVRGGVEQYLKMIEPIPELSEPRIPSGAVADVSARADRQKQVAASNLAESIAEFRHTQSEETAVEDSEYKGRKEGETMADTKPSDSAERDLSEHSNSSQSLHTLDAQSPRVVSAAYSSSTTTWHPDIVSVDDLDFSDMSSNEDEPAPPPPGLRRLPRRLPLRREFEFVRRSVDSVSSMGIISHPSIAISEKTDSVRSSSSSHQGLGAALQQWQVNALIDDLSDDEDGPGDAEAALRRLEGQINHQQQRAKEAKVNGWVRTIQERMATGDIGDDQLRNLSDAEDEDDDDNSDEDYGTGGRSRDLSIEQEDVTISTSQGGSRSLEGLVDPSSTVSLIADVGDPGESVTPTYDRTTHKLNDSPAAPSPVRDGKPKVDEAVPPEILQSRIPSRPSTSSGPTMNNPDLRNNQTPSLAHFVAANIPSMHRSFILAYRSETLAQHFSVIDREIFLGIKFEELISEDWMTSSEELNVLDWGQYLRDRRRKVESRGKGKTSALSAARARFNLVANFTLSEIVLSHPNERVVVVNKFIRIAWKAYLQDSFATLVAIISGLTSDWVKKVMRRSWNRVGIWEMRVFEDLKAFTTSDDNFRYIRKSIAGIADAKPLSGGGPDDSIASTGPTDVLSSGSKSKSNVEGKPAPTSCIPFLGVYLSQLYKYSKMPDLIDPSAPTESVGVDPATGNFNAPAHVEVFSTLQPLPASMQLEPLINVQKQRLIAGVIKSLVAGQHLANKVEVNIDKKLLHRCLKLRALDSDSLQRIVSLYSDY